MFEIPELPPEGCVRESPNYLAFVIDYLGCWAAQKLDQ
jgi:hypothetical protein